MRHAGAVGYARGRGGSGSRPRDAGAGIAHTDPDRVDLEVGVPRHPHARRAVRRDRARRRHAGCPRGVRKRHPSRHRGGLRSRMRGGGYGRCRSHARQRRIGRPGGATGAAHRVPTGTRSRGAQDCAHPRHHRVADGSHAATSGPRNGDARDRAHPARSRTRRRHANGRGGSGSLGSRPLRPGGRRNSVRGADAGRPGSTARAAATLHGCHMARLAPDGAGAFGRRYGPGRARGDSG